MAYGNDLYGLNFKLGFVGFANKWFGARVYGFLDWFNTSGTEHTKTNLLTYGGGGDLIVNLIPLDKFALGLIGGVQLAETLGCSLMMSIKRDSSSYGI